MTGLQALLHLSLQPLLVSLFLLPPTNLKLQSQNFQHILTWNEPNDGPLIYYDVFYSTQFNHSPFVRAKKCTNITTQRCDLTKDFTDILEEYVTGVQSFTHYERTNLTILPKPLNPLMDTEVGPPIVDIAACDKCVELSIHPPISYLWNEKEQRNVTMLSKDVFNKMDYVVHMVPSTDAPIILRNIVKDLYTTEISNLLPNTNYCVSVDITEIMNRKQVVSPMKCVVTKGAQRKGDADVYYISVAAAVLAIGLLLVLCTLDKAGYISKKKMLTPNALKSLPNANNLLSGNKEIIPLETLILTETARNIEVEEGPILRAGVQDNASYIANIPAFRFMEQHMRNKDSFIDEELSKDNSSLSIASLQLQGFNISEEARDQAELFLSIVNVTEGPPVVGAMSSITIDCDDINKASNLFTGEKKIDINTISVAVPEDLWSSCRTAESSRLETELRPTCEDPVGTLHFRLFSNVLVLDELQMSSLEDVMKVEDLPCEDDEQCPSDYIKR
ncbi:interferon alpha/beta receptor 2-like [Hyla sarda]|uniref:interferon alpha/beta receptor 2-like n=1 Tax=Hyla sarda TaxID=327740 RepID=UPI0024C45052|nr:interferon alpha/beta receptor 2-like [Hyla sarda]